MARSKKEQLEYDALVKEYHRLAKKADTSLRATEAYQHDKNFGIMIKWAYADAMRDIKRFGGNKRFDTKAPESKTQLQAKINAIKSYLSAPTRTKTGVRKIFKEKADTINSEYGTDFTWSEVGTFFESEIWTKLENIYGSKTALRVVGTLKKKGADIIKEIAEQSDIHKKVKDDLVEKVVSNRIKELDLKWSDLI